MKILILALTLIVNSLAAAQTPALNLSLSKKIADKVFECAVKNNWKLSVALVNSEGQLITFNRMDGAYQGSIEAAQDKAKSANAFQRSTKVFADAVNKDGRVGLLSVKNVVANEGGLPVIINGQHSGAVGVSGAKATEDEQCALEAIKEIK